MCVSILTRHGISTARYVLYEDAWWRNVLNLTYGSFNNSAAPECQTSGTAVPQFPPFVGRYHDGDVRCDGGGGGGGATTAPLCRGFLEVAYAFDDVSLAYFQPYVHTPEGHAVLAYDAADTSLGALRGGGGAAADASVDASAGAARLLDAVHAELVRLHTDALTAAGALERVRDSTKPSGAALAVWDRAVVGLGAGIHDWARDDRADATCGSFDEGEARMPAAALQLRGGGGAASIAEEGVVAPVFVANEAFSGRHGWCEGALAMAENVLAAAPYALPRPAWLDEATYRDDVLYAA